MQNISIPIWLYTACGPVLKENCAAGERLQM